LWSRAFCTTRDFSLFARAGRGASKASVANAASKRLSTARLPLRPGGPSPPRVIALEQYRPAGCFRKGRTCGRLSHLGVGYPLAVRYAAQPVYRRAWPTLTIIAGFFVGLFLARTDHIVSPVEASAGPVKTIPVTVDWTAPPLAGGAALRSGPGRTCSRRGRAIRRPLRGPRRSTRPARLRRAGKRGPGGHRLPPRIARAGGSPRPLECGGERRRQRARCPTQGARR